MNYKAVVPSEDINNKGEVSMRRMIAVSFVAVVFALLAIAPNAHAGDGSWSYFSEQNYTSTMSKGKYVLLGFMKDGCPECKAERDACVPVFTESKYDNITPFRVDYDKQAAFRQKLGVTTHPTVILMRNKKEVGRLTGSFSSEQLRALLNKAT
jgi:thiol-disulfide isomerase/thioredoxin